MTIIKQGFENGGILAGFEKTPITYGSNILLDGGLESWVTSSTGFTSSSFGDGTNPTQSNDSNGGSYAIQLNGGGGVPFVDGGSILIGAVHGLTAGDSYNTQFYSKNNGVIYILYSSDNGADQIFWNFFGPNAGTWTVNNHIPISDQAYPFTVGANYAQFFSQAPQVVVPASGILYLYIVSDDVILVDDITLKKNGIGPNVLINGDFESWSLTDVPTHWVVGGGVSSREDVTVHSGTHAIKISDGNARLEQALSGLNVNDLYRLTLWAKTNAMAFIEISIANDSVIGSIHGKQTSWWNFITNQWDIVAQGTRPTGDQIFGYPATGIFTQYSTTRFKVPVNGNIVVFIGGSAEIFFDDISLEKATIPGDITLFDEINSSDQANLSATDRIFSFRTIGGNPKAHFYQTADGKFHTENQTFDFSSKKMVVDEIISTRTYGSMYVFNNVIDTTIDSINVYHGIRVFNNGIANLWEFHNGDNGSISAFSDYSGTVEGTVKITDIGHNLSTNDVVTIAGTTNYNGVFLVTKINNDNFYITTPWIANDAVGNWYRPSSLKATIQAAGIYSISWSASLRVSADGKTIRISAFQNATQLNSLNAKVVKTIGSENQEISRTGLVSIGSGDHISLAVSNLTDATDVLISDANLSLHKVG